MYGSQVFRYDWETNTFWYDASRHDATFVITDLAGSGLSPSAESYFGKPAKIEHVAQWTILIYQKNLLRQVDKAGTGPQWLLLPGAAAGRRHALPAAVTLC
jgi:hypothetical protein